MEFKKLLKKVKKLYYLVVLSGLLFTFTNMTLPKGVELPGGMQMNPLSQLQELSKMQDLTGGDSVSLVPSVNPLADLQKLKDMQAEAQARMQAIEKMSANIQKKSGLDFSRKSYYEFIEKVQSKNGTSYDVYFDPYTGLYNIQNRNYVYIDGKYFPHNPANIYNVGGMKTIFRPRPTKEGSPGMDNKFAGNSLEMNQINTNVAPGGAMNAENIKNIMANLKKAQKNIHLKNQALDELMKE